MPEPECRTGEFIPSRVRKLNPQLTGLIDGTPRGVFTYHLYQVLRDAPQTAPQKDIVKGVCAAIRQDRYRQTPQLEGPAERLTGPIFG
jgi:hypothetical protein